MQHEFWSCLTEFLQTGASDRLQTWIQSHPEVLVAPLGEYPDVHRIVDVRLETGEFRICRKISAGEALTAAPIEKPSKSPGVPLWLTGEKLREWAALEAQEPSDEPTDWGKYR